MQGIKVITQSTSQYLNERVECLQNTFLPIYFASFFGLYVLLTGIAYGVLPEPKGVQKLKNPQKQKALYYGEFVSFIHSIISLILVFYSWSQVGIAYNTKSVFFQYLALTNSLAYFIVDELGSEIFRYADTMSRFHHSMALSGTFLCFCYYFGAPQSTFGIFVAEISNPFLQGRNTIRRYGIDSGILYQFLQKTFVVIFLLLRFVLGAPIIWQMFRSQNCPIIFPMLTGGLIGISTIWCIQIINMVWKAINTKITSNGANPLSKNWLKVHYCVKGLKSRKIVAILVVYVLVMYFFLPIYLFRNPIELVN